MIFKFEIFDDIINGFVATIQIALTGGLHHIGIYAETTVGHSVEVGEYNREWE